MTFAEKLKDLKSRSGMSEARLAELSGVKLGALHTYILGTRTPSFPAVVKLAKALGTTCEAFADCEDVDDEAPAPKKKPRGKPKKGTS